MYPIKLCNSVDGIALPVTFVGEEEEVYEIQWTEFLTLDLEEPFNDLNELKTGMTVLAPWGKVNYAKAVVMTSEGIDYPKTTTKMCSVAF